MGALIDLIVWVLKKVDISSHFVEFGNKHGSRCFRRFGSIVEIP
jgi:hypothetical protein